MDESKKARLISATERSFARKRDNWRAVQRLWQPHVDRGDVDAKVCLAHLILWYMSAPDCVNKQMRAYLRDAAQSGHANALYWTTRYGEKEGQEAYELLLRAGQMGSRGSQRDLGALYATGDWAGPRDTARAVYWYRLAAERGHDDAQYNLGIMYLSGEGTDPSREDGLSWLNRAATQGDSQSRRVLAEIYRNGYYGVPKSIEETKRWEHLQYVAELKT
ncbi:MAG: tetratricopeptide repeat protein [Terracidiphilus sp.]|jgi:TPR repeat protein